VAYVFAYSNDAVEHIRMLPANRRAFVVSELERRLLDQPTVETRNRKRMDPDKRMYIAPWELRLGDLRVYYAVEDDRHRVVILAVGIKQRERLFIGGREFTS
jgi:mRNA-degrading endonuclease RelE of RelBE toxin-antitoxin system